MHATLADFGLAKPLRAAEAAAGRDTGGTGTGIAHEAGDTPAGDLGDTMGVGTPRYMAPEVIKHPSSATLYTPSCDVYSFAFVLYEMMHGHIAFDDVASLDDVLSLVLGGVRPKIDLPPDRAGFAPIISAAWVQSATARPTMDVMLEHIGLLIGPEALNAASRGLTSPGELGNRSATNSSGRSWSSHAESHKLSHADGTPSGPELVKAFRQRVRGMKRGGNDIPQVSL